MKLLLALAALLLTAISSFATVTINFGAGDLYQSDGTTPIPFGSLLQIVVSTTDNTFTAPTAGNFTGGSSDDVIWASFGTNDNAGSGTFTGQLVLTLSGNITAGDQILLRWWPTLTTSSTSPSPGDTFGQFRTDAQESFSSPGGWVVPADGQTITLNFLTQNLGGAEPESAGRATFTVAPIPEPSTFALMIAGGVGFLALRSRGRR